MSNHGMTKTQTKQAKSALWALYRDCKICGKPLPGIDKSTIDHIVPVSKGGSNDLSNLQLVHSKCNNLKDSRVFLQIFTPKRFVYKGELLNMIDKELKKCNKSLVINQLFVKKI